MTRPSVIPGQSLRPLGRLTLAVATVACCESFLAVPEKETLSCAYVFLPFIVSVVLTSNILIVYSAFETLIKKIKVGMITIMCFPVLRLGSVI